MESETDEKIRFEKELEFVQLLSNASYLNYLAQYKYFDDPKFVNYLKYLLYWKTSDYIKYISYPHCLYFLDRLQNVKFREECKKPSFTNFVTQQQGLHWQYHLKNRANEIKNNDDYFDMTKKKKIVEEDKMDLEENE